MLETLRSGDRERFVDLCIRHLEPSRDAYIEAYKSMFGGAG